MKFFTRLIIGVLIISALTYGFFRFHQKENVARIQAQKEKFERIASARLNDAENTQKDIRLERTHFKFESFEDLESFQNQLERIFPFATPVQNIDDILVNKLKAYRSDNLTGNDETKQYRKGSSSADNYVFYYKPSNPENEEDWQNTKSGWVVKIIHGNFPQKTDSGVNIIMGGSGKGLKEIHALAVPSAPENNEQIKLVKELLQYKEDTTPVETFAPQEWAKILFEQQDSKCMNDLSYDCLSDEIYKLLDIPNKKQRHSYLLYLADMALDYGDAEAAEKLIQVWPTDEEIKTYEESFSRLLRKTDAGISHETQKFERKKLLLLFLAGDYEENEKRLIEMNDQDKAGTDYGAIDVLVKKGDLEQAMKIAELTLEWQRIEPDPKRSSSAHLHCNAYQNPKTRPAAMGDLAQAYIRNGDFEKAYTVAKMIKHYWENDAFGQSSFCYTNFAQSSYFSAMKSLFENYMKKGQDEKAKAMFEELVQTQKEQTDVVKRYSKGTFEALARIAAENGMIDLVEDIAAFLENKLKMDYPAVYNNSTNDPLALIYALSGNYEKAIDRIENHNYEQDKKEPTALDKIVQLESTPSEEIRLTTYLATARALKDIGDRKGTILFLDKATKYFNTRKPKYDAAVDNLNDYIVKGQILLDIGEKEKSHEVLKELIDRFNQTTPDDYRGGGITANFYGHFALFYTHHEDIKTVQKWANELPSYYSGAYFSRIGELLVRQERWEELDYYFDEMIKAYATDYRAIGNWHHVLHALIDAQKFDLYLSFLEKADDISKEAKARQPKRRGTIVHGKTAETPDTKKQIWVMDQLLISEMNDKDVPNEVIQKIWLRYLSNCRRWQDVLPRHSHENLILPSASETMASCYAHMIRSANIFSDRFR